MSYIDLDILNIDNKIKNIFDEERKTLPIYKERLRELQITFNNCNIPIRFRTDIEKNISELIDTIQKIEENIKLNFYISETTELIEKYKQILKIPIKLSFTGKNKLQDVLIKKILS